MTERAIAGWLVLFAFIVLLALIGLAYIQFFVDLKPSKWSIQYNGFSATGNELSLGFGFILLICFALVMRVFSKFWKAHFFYMPGYEGPRTGPQIVSFLSFMAISLFSVTGVLLGVVAFFINY